MDHCRQFKCVFHLLISLQVGTTISLWFVCYSHLYWCLKDLTTNTALFLCHTQIVWGLDDVTLLNPPEEPVSGYVLKVLYSCDHPSVVQLDCVLSFDTGESATIPLRHWSCVPGNPKVKRLILTLPDWLVYQADGIVPDSQWVMSCILRASVRGDGSDDSDTSVLVRDAVNLRPTPPLSRPLKQHQLCHAWSTQMLWLTHRTSKTLCPLEQGNEIVLGPYYHGGGDSLKVRDVKLWLDGS